MFVMHGAAYMTLKTEGDLCERMRRWNIGGWAAFVPLYLAATLASLSVASYAFDGLARNPLFWLIVALLAGGLIVVPFANLRRDYGRLFLGTTTIVVAVIALAAVGIFPRLLPSTLDPAYSLDIYNAASTPLTQKVMLIITLIGMPLVIAYTVYIYRIFKGKVVLGDESY